MTTILFIGDIVGKAGRASLARFLPELVDKYKFDLVIANGENATHGKGLNKRHYRELVNLGIDAFTLGNHFDDRAEIRNYIENVNNIARPLNLIQNYPGDGSIIVTAKNGVKVRITNILGQAFMKEVITSPYVALKSVTGPERSMIHIVDYHAETTAEKMTIGWEFAGKVSAILGTHTHVQTRDNRILPGGTAYISDVGMTGAYNGVIGAERNSVIQKVWFDKKIPFNYDNDDDTLLFSAVILTFNETTGEALSITPVYELWEQNE